MTIPSPQNVLKAKFEMMGTDGIARVLVVDDLAINRFVAATMFQKLGCLVDTVDSGEAAVKAVTEHRYDVVLMDLHMPSLDGIQTTLAIRALDEEAARVPIVALTADNSRTAKDRCIAAGMNAFLTKPVMIDDLRWVLLGYVR